METKTKKSELARKILKISKDIKTVTVSDLNGIPIYHATRKSSSIRVKSIASRKRLAIAARAWKTRKEIMHGFGKQKYSLAEFDRVKRITIPVGKKHLIFVTASPRFDHKRIVKRIHSIKSPDVIFEGRKDSLSIIESKPYEISYEQEKISEDEQKSLTIEDIVDQTEKPVALTVHPENKKKILEKFGTDL